MEAGGVTVKKEKYEVCDSKTRRQKDKTTEGKGTKNAKKFKHKWTKGPKDERAKKVFGYS